MNLQFDNRHPEKLLSLIGSIQPDAITLNEVSDKWAVVLRGLSGAYPYSVICPPLAILSRRPFERLALQSCYKGATLATAAVDFDGQEVTVAAVHLGWPWPHPQYRQIDAVAPLLGALTGTVILAGDFNAAGWSVAASRLAKAGGLTLAPSIGPSWLFSSLPKALRPWIGLPIDHVFAKGNVVIHSAKVQADAGSDHLPVLVEFSLLAGTPAADKQ
jgi:endonuclease/exonuclease/phosphatase (EEP) superfamily protein YafD